ncbi:hypothetical protein [Iningainema tapete]|uniref:Uncharacterized protein n=1 Tax=Iningainema tapete BLCC-T55 TaxID=2748662 RepID=A0A8J6XJB3_9CYAN|nr:hypothetical protein [Iningainema tapete]MBD2771816.1 hypothetical protein [Iningainema tapete BLCC-T55]
MMFHFHYFKKALVSLAIFGIFLNIPMPVKAQNVVSRQQLDQLSLQELRILRREQARQARIIIGNCYRSPYIDSSICYTQYLQYQKYFADLDNYIAQRRVRGR